MINKNPATEIIGTKGRITFPSFALTNPVILETETGRQEFILPPPQHIQQPFIQTIVNELNAIEKCPSTGDSAKWTNWVIDKIIENYRRTNY